MRAVDKAIIRRKGGPKKSAMRNSPKFRNVRYSQSEFKIRARAVRYVRTSMIYQNILADHNFAGPLNGLMRKVQVLNKVNDLGQRGVFLSRYKEYYISMEQVEILMDRVKKIHSVVSIQTPLARWA